MASLLIDQGADFTGPDCGGMFPIFEALKLEALDTAELLLKNGIDINKQEKMRKLTPLLYAAMYGKTRAVKWLLDHGADVNLQDRNGETAVTIGASYKGNVEIVRMLLDHGAKLTSQSITKLSYNACRQGKLGILNFLLTKAVTPDFEACYKALAFLHSPNQDVLKWLKARAEIRNIDVGKSTLFHIAVEKNNLDVVKMFIDSGVDVNKKDRYNSTPLASALEGMENPISRDTGDYREMFLLLLKNGADPNIMYGHKYAQDNSKNLLSELADIDSCSGIKNVRSSKYLNQRRADMISIAKLLLSYGANVNASDQKGTTPLHRAAEKNNIPMIKLLVSHGADLRAANGYGVTPLDYSIIYGGNYMSCKLHTINTLLSLEADHGGIINWKHIRSVADRSSIHGRQQIIALIDQLEKKPSALIRNKSKDKIISKAIDDTYKSQKANLSSNDPQVVAAAAKAHAKLKGKWIIDPEATKEFLKNNPLSSKARELFGLASPFILGVIVDFKDGGITLSAQNGDKKFTYCILPQQNGEMKYLAENKRSSEVDVLTVTRINERNIKITPLRKNGLGLFLWKRAKFHQDVTSHGSTAEHTMEFWKQWYKDINLIFKENKQNTKND
jgi:ankyrin repeat protein